MNLAKLAASIPIQSRGFSFENSFFNWEIVTPAEYFYCGVEKGLVKNQRYVFINVQFCSDGEPCDPLVRNPFFKNKPCIMKTIRTSVMLIPLMAILLMGCKRESLNHEPVAQEPGMGEKVKAWYEARPASQTTGKVKSISRSDRYFSEPDWSTTRYYPASQLFISPVKFDPQKTAVNSNQKKFLVTTGNSDGIISSGKYIYLLTKKAEGPAPAFVQNAEPAFLMQQKIPAGFSGAVFEYDLDNNFISGRYYEHGKQTDNITRLSYKSGSTGNGSNYADPNCEGVVICVEWYWQTWVNGVLVYEEYLYTTCECMEQGGGGGGGQTQTPQQMLDQVLLNGHPVSIKTGSSLVSESSTIRVRDYIWMYYVISFNSPVGIGSCNFSYYSKERGTQYYGTDNRWHWQSLEHISHSREGFSFGLLGFNLNNQVFTPTINTGPQGNYAKMDITYEATASMIYEGINVFSTFSLQSSGTWNIFEYWGGMPSS